MPFSGEVVCELSAADTVYRTSKILPLNISMLATYRVRWFWLLGLLLRGRAKGYQNSSLTSFNLDWDRSVMYLDLSRTSQLVRKIACQNRYTSSFWGSQGRYDPPFTLIPNFPKRTTNLQHSKRDGGFVLDALPLHTGRLIGLARLVSGRSKCLPSLLLSSEWFVYCLIVSSFMICFLPPVWKFYHLLWWIFEEMLCWFL